MPYLASIGLLTTKTVKRSVGQQNGKAVTKLTVHYESMSMQYTAIFHGSKIEKKLDKKLIIFLFLLKT